MALAMKRAIAEFEAGSGLKNLNTELAKISPNIKASVDVESIKALQGKYQWSSKEEVDAPIAVLKHFTRDYNVLKTIVDAFKKITKDAIGKEAIQSEVEKVIISVIQDPAQVGSCAVSWKVEKKDKDFYITAIGDWPSKAKDTNNSYPAEDDLAKLIEATL